MKPLIKDQHYWSTSLAGNHVPSQVEFSDKLDAVSQNLSTERSGPA